MHVAAHACVLTVQRIDKPKNDLCILCSFVFMNFLACVWYYVATIEGVANSWLTSVSEFLDQSTPLSSQP